MTAAFSGFRRDYPVLSLVSGKRGRVLDFDGAHVLVLFEGEPGPTSCLPCNVEYDAERAPPKYLSERDAFELALRVVIAMGFRCAQCGQRMQTHDVREAREMTGGAVAHGKCDIRGERP